MNYNTNNSKRARMILVILLAAIVVIGLAYVTTVKGAAEGQLARVWILCKPGTQVNVRRQPTTDSKSETQLDAGEEILTDGTDRDGWIRVYGVGENGGGWVYAGFIATEQPVAVGEQYVCVAPKRAACRRWIGGPQIDGRAGWLKNGENVDVFLAADGWAVTSRGYIQTEWLEADP